MYLNRVILGIMELFILCDLSSEEYSSVFYHMVIYF